MIHDEIEKDDSDDGNATDDNSVKAGGSAGAGGRRMKKANGCALKMWKYLTDE